MIAFAYYLLKVIICSGMLFLYYHIALRNKLFHQWNRFYLLISVFISLIAPVVQVSIMHQISGEPNKAIQMLQVFQSADGYLEEVTISGHQKLSSYQWLMIIYIGISIALLLFALLSLRKIVSIIQSHSIQWIEGIKFINTTAQGTPFSFFNFIFWNDEIDLKTETGKQIFQHELVHVKEKHTVDKLLMQLILVVFWCNPFFWFIRRELQLIHEFIADKKSVGEHGTAALASMILSSFYPTQFNALTNQFFQTSIKRRLAMLSKIQNVKFNYISRILALPILAITVLAFTLRTKTLSIQTLKLDKTITVVIDAGHGIMGNGKPNGVSVNGISEDNLVLSIANKIKGLNTNDKLNIVLTRTSDKLIDLHKRVDIARENNADLFICLHIDAKADNRNAGMTSEKSLSSGFGIYISNKQSAYQSQSETLGSIVREELNSIYPTNPYLLKRQVGIWVLDQNICPSILLECGFLNDEKDREFISKEKNQTAIAQKILLAIERYAANQLPIQKTTTDTVPKVQVKEVVIKNSSSSTGTETKKLDIKTNWKDNPPLFIVDGEEKIKADVDRIIPETIESITVLKGTSATEKYGKKGTNGAIEITLKTSKTINEVTLKPVSNDTIPKSRSFDDPGLPQLKLSQLNNLTNMKQLNLSNVSSFQIVCPDKKGISAHVNEGAEFDETTRLMLTKSKPGDIVTIEKIITLEKGKEIKRPGLMFGIIQ
ncbi:MAG TPA: N-acetylmuramoyl-L-alanine amidase [Flavisolibacter sp.]|jgi:N-acetylmuramoyl-L-alanine amidase|nr:N-acetylmuramoyl-L-alanine amidase [Flavisolibacter sp.]